MKTIIGISGSLRKGSFNTALLRAAGKCAPEGIEIIIKSIEGIPLYNGDVEERDGIPAPVQELKDAIAAAQGLLIVTPEYNNSIPGVIKNAIDWLSRPPEDVKRVFHGKPVAVIGATTGSFGTILAQSACLPVLRTLRTRPWLEGRLLVSRARKVFGEDGEIMDEDVRDKLRAFIEGFSAAL